VVLSTEGIVEEQARLKRVGGYFRRDEFEDPPVTVGTHGRAKRPSSVVHSLKCFSEDPDLANMKRGDQVRGSTEPCVKGGGDK
jgi:hypothetical protein